MFICIFVFINIQIQSRIIYLSLKYYAGLCFEVRRFMFIVCISYIRTSSDSLIFQAMCCAALARSKEAHTTLKYSSMSQSVQKFIDLTVPPKQQVDCECLIYLQICRFLMIYIIDLCVIVYIFLVEGSTL